MSTLRHDMRNQLTVITGNARFLHDFSELCAEDRVAAADILDAARALQVMISSPDQAPVGIAL